MIIIILIILFSGLAVSYYVGWWHGFHMNEEHRHVLNCLLEPDSDFLCLEHLYYPHIASGANTLRDLELGPFGNNVNYNDHSNDFFLKFLREQIVGVPVVVNYDDHNILEHATYDIGYNKPIHFIFDEIFYGKNIVIELGINDVYSISFWKNDMWVDRLLIHTDNLPKDIESQIFQSEIPYLVQKTGFDKIVILPVKGDGEFMINRIALDV